MYLISLKTGDDDDDDFAFQPEEQQVDETYEQFEERVLNKRAGHMYHIVKSKLTRADKLFLSEMVHRNNRKQVMQLLIVTVFTVCPVHS
jgi:cohesin complex subunit SCC1